MKRRTLFPEFRLGAETIIGYN